MRFIITIIFYWSQSSSTTTFDPGFLQRTHTIYFTFEFDARFTLQTFHSSIFSAKVKFYGLDFHVRIFLLDAEIFLSTAP